jgi:hypothetical protein
MKHNTKTSVSNKEFTRIKWKIKEYRRSSLVHCILEILNDIQRQNSKLPFWDLLVLLKWCYLHTDDTPSRKNAKPLDIQVILKLIEKFQTDHPVIQFTDHKSVSQSFRIIAYQQFEYQEQFYIAIISRQLVLYLQLRSRIDIDNEFKGLANIDLKAFFQYCFYAFAFINRSEYQKGYRYEGVLDNAFFNFFKEVFSARELDCFLKLITISEPKQFETLHKLQDERLQLYETNFFITKPLLFFQGQYRLPHKAILNQTLKHYVYTFLKSSLPDTFPDEFGKRMEKYVELGLKEGKFNYKNEAELKKSYNLGKVSDYLVDPDILLECKAIELHPRSGVLRLPAMLTKEMNTSVIKAYQQLLCTANAIDPNQEWFGIIITYREMYLGFGLDAWDEFLKAPIEEFLKEQNISANLLTPQNLFFVTIEDWDYIVQVVKEGKTTLKQILLKAKETNASESPAEKLFLMEMVIHKFFKIENLDLSYLKNVFETYIYSDTLKI